MAEASATLGGQIPLASSIEPRAELGTIIDYQINELQRLEVDVKLETLIDVTMINDLKPDAVIIATGSQPRTSPISSDDSIPVIAPIEVMASPETYIDKNVIVVDHVAHFPAYAPAEALKDAGAEVMIVTPKLFVGSLLDQATMVRTLRRLASKGVQMVPNSTAVKISDGLLHIQDTLSGQMRTEKPDVIIAAVGNQVVDTLAKELTEDFHHLNVHVIGDASAPRTILEAIREGRITGRSV